MMMQELFNIMRGFRGFGLLGTLFVFLVFWPFILTIFSVLPPQYSIVMLLLIFLIFKAIPGKLRSSWLNKIKDDEAAYSASDGQDTSRSQTKVLCNSIVPQWDRESKEKARTWNMRKIRELNDKRWSIKDNINFMDPRRFEEHIAELYRSKGYRVTLTPQSKDGGIDVYASKEDYTICIQCKHQPTSKIGRPDLQRLMGACAGITAYDRPIAEFITSGDYSEGAVEYAKLVNLKLMNGKDLIAETLEMINKTYVLVMLCETCGENIEMSPSTFIGKFDCSRHHSTVINLPGY